MRTEGGGFKEHSTDRERGSIMWLEYRSVKEGKGRRMKLNRKLISHAGGFCMSSFKREELNDFKQRTS